MPCLASRSTFRRRCCAAAFAALLAASAATLAGCGAWRPATVPLATTLDKSRCAERSDTLLVLLPGAYSLPEEFVREGFVDAVAERRLAVDVLRVDAHLGYYNRGSIFDRLREDIVAPARAQGYRSIWMLGISVGGLGALGYSDRFPGELSGIVAIAPYLGERITSTEIANAGGLVRWQAPADPTTLDLRLWRRLQRYGVEPDSVDLPPLYLGYGRADRFVFSHRLLGAALPPSRVFVTDGGHDWPPWRRLWSSILPTLPLPSCSARAG